MIYRDWETHCSYTCLKNTSTHLDSDDTLSPCDDLLTQFDRQTDTTVCDLQRLRDPLQLHLPQEHLDTLRQRRHTFTVWWPTDPVWQTDLLMTDSVIWITISKIWCSMYPPQTDINSCVSVKYVILADLLFQADKSNAPHQSQQTRSFFHQSLNVMFVKSRG